MRKYIRAGHATDDTLAHAVSGWVPKAKNTLAEYVILIDFLLQQSLHEGISMLRHTYIVCIVTIALAAQFYDAGI